MVRLGTILSYLFDGCHPKHLKTHFRGIVMGCVMTSLLYVYMNWQLLLSPATSANLYPDGVLEQFDNSWHQYLFRGPPPLLSIRNLDLYFTAAASIGSPIQKELNWPKSLAEEYNTKKMLLGAVLVSKSRLDQAVINVNDTWGPSLSDYVFFIRDSVSVPTNLKRFPVVQLRVSRESTSTVEMFALLKYLHANYLEQYKWFIVASTEAYVAGEALQEVLQKLDSQSIVYLGKAGSTNPAEMFKLRMMVNEYFCEGGPGIVLSNGALRAIVPHLDECLVLIQGYNKKLLSRSDDIQLNRADVELGRCFSRKLNIYCSTSQESQRYFVHDSKGESVRLQRLQESFAFQELLTLYPIQDATHMDKVHYFCKTRKFQTKLLVAERSASEFCTSLRGHSQIAAPFSATFSRNCNLFNETQCKGIISRPTAAEDVPRPFFTESFNDITDFVHIDSGANYYYVSQTSSPVFEVAGELAEELQYVVKEAVQIINRQEAANYELEKIVNGYLRYSGTRGREYILDLELSTNQHVIQRRLNLLRTHHPQFVVLPDSGEKSRTTMVNFVVPISNVKQRLNEFLLMYEDLCLRTKENTRLVLAVFGKEDVEIVKEAVEEYAKKYPHMQYKIVSSDEQFSRGRALDLGMSVLSKTDLAFMCDVDMTVEPAFLSHCRMNTIHGKRIYFPECFKYYSMDYVYKLRRPLLTSGIEEKHGHWVTYGFGMLCIYKSDYDTVGGFDTTIEGWGGEDVDLIKKILKEKFEVMKAPDPALTHRYHDKQCSGELSPIQFKDCLSSRANGLAGRKELAEYVLYLEDKYHLSNRQLW